MATPPRASDDEIDTDGDRALRRRSVVRQDVVSLPIVFAPENPYYFIDTNGNGVAIRRRWMKATGITSSRLACCGQPTTTTTYSKDPGAFGHNPKYVLQALYDSLEDLGKKVTVDMTGMVRP